MNTITATPVEIIEYQKEIPMTNKIEFEVPMQVLDAATYCSAKNDIRFYLVGIAINKGHVVSTDGHRAFACKIDGLNEEIEFIIPTDSVKAFIKKVPSKNRKANCRISYDPQTKQGEFAYLELQVRELFLSIDGKYPDWRRIFPRGREDEYKGAFPQFNWSYMSDFQKMHKALGGNGIGAYLYPTSVNAVALVEFNDTKFFSNAKACIMPLRA